MEKRVKLITKLEYVKYKALCNKYERTQRKKRASLKKKSHLGVKPKSSSHSLSSKF